MPRRLVPIGRAGLPAMPVEEPAKAQGVDQHPRHGKDHAVPGTDFGLETLQKHQKRSKKIKKPSKSLGFQPILGRVS